jgi:hypothetical protein
MKLTFLGGTVTVTGSPGMEQGGRIDPYTVLLLQRDVRTLAVSSQASVRWRTDGGCMSAQIRFNGTDPDIFGSGCLFGAALPAAVAGKGACEVWLACLESPCGKAPFQSDAPFAKWVRSSNSCASENS